MSDQYTVELGFNRPPEDIRHMAQNLRKASDTIPQWMVLEHESVLEQQWRTDMLYSADVMDEIANKMEQGNV